MITTSDLYHKLAFGQVINPLVWLYISFDKELDLGSFFTLNQSKLNGSDILKATSSDVAAQDWDFYQYKEYTDRVVSVNWERSLEFPYQIQCGMIDFTLDNSDEFFTPLNLNSSIGEYNLPSRPLKLFAGYNGASDVLPQFVGLTQSLPNVNIDAKTVSYHGVDFLYDICNQSLSSAVNMRDVRADEVIEAILKLYGLAPSQYRLAKGRFNIPFVFFDIGEDAGAALKQLVQSENGYMWLDEQGVVRFETSASANSDTNIVAKLTDYEIISLASSSVDNILNHVRIQTEIREVQEWQEVYAKSSSAKTVSDSLWVVDANSTFTMSCNLSDPCYDVVAPTLGKASSVSWFTAMTSNLTPVTRGVTATGELTSNAFIVTFTNNNSFPIEIDEMKLWGEPAKVYDVLDYDAYDDESVEKYGDQLLEITDNRFFQTYYQADSYARSLIQQHKDYRRDIVAEIKGDFSFQLMDMITIETASGEYDGIYRIMGISYSWDGKNLVTKLSLNGTSIKEGAFTLNISKLNGEDKIQ